VPQAIPVLVAAVATYAGASATVVAIASAVASLAVTAAEQKRAQGKAKRRARTYPRNASFRSSVAPQAIVYGKAQVGGPITYVNTVHTAGSTNNTDLWWVQPLAGHQCADIEDVWVDDKRTTLAQITTGGGAVLTGSPFFNGTGLASFFRHLGTASQVVNADLQTAMGSSEIPNTFRGRGLTYLVCRFILANDSRNMFSGVPQNIRALVKGAKVYDPRRDPTAPEYGGTGAQDFDDAGSYEWSDNPALCLADYLTNQRYGMKEPYTGIDWVMVKAAADHCDATVTIPGGSEKRFSCNGALSMEDEHRQNITSILSSMGGSLVRSGGKFRIRAHQWVGSVGTLTDDDILPQVKFRPTAPKADSYNAVRATIFDKDRQYQDMDAGEITSVGP
jgi:hypothetical protein